MTVAAPVFTADWSGARDYWQTMFDDIGMTGQPNLRFLEVGCFEGRATLWLLENVLTDSTARIVAVDTFEGSPEFESMRIDGNSRARFEQNTDDHRSKVTVRQGDSKQVLRSLLPPTGRESAYPPPFDFVYIDGSHRAPDVLADAVLAWPLIRSGGVLAFDDYEWGPAEPETATPRLAIDVFLRVYADELRVRHQAYQVAVEKL